MPAYKDIERMTPQQLAEFILKDRICKNCKYWDKARTEWAWGDCMNDKIDITGWVKYDFGCSHWEEK